MISINEKSCIKCGLCAKHCPFDLFGYEAKQLPQLRPNYENVCLLCGHCAAICPKQAIKLSDEILSNGLEDIEPQASLTDFSYLVKNRRSTRCFNKQLIPQNEIIELIELSQYSPSAKNSQPVEWIVVSGYEQVHNFSSLALDWLIEQKILSPNMRDSFASGYDIVNRGAPHLVIVHANEENHEPLVDCTIALRTFELAAQAKNWGTCWAGFFKIAATNNPAIQQQLDMPAGHKMYYALMLGYPTYKFTSIPPRNKISAKFI